MGAFTGRKKSGRLKYNNKLYYIQPTATLSSNFGKNFDLTSINMKKPLCGCTSFVCFRQVANQRAAFKFSHAPAEKSLDEHI